MWVAVGVAEVEGMQARRRLGLRRHLRHQHLRLDRQGVVLPLPLGKRGPEYHHLVATSALFASTPSRQNHVPVAKVVANPRAQSARASVATASTATAFLSGCPRATLGRATCCVPLTRVLGSGHNVEANKPPSLPLPPLPLLFSRVLSQSPCNVAFSIVVPHTFEVLRATRGAYSASICNSNIFCPQQGAHTHVHNVNLILQCRQGRIYGGPHPALTHARGIHARVECGTLCRSPA